MSKPVFLLAFLPSAVLAAGSGPSVLLAHVSGQFVCEQQSKLDIEPLVENFLSAQGFQVLNLAKVQRWKSIKLQGVRILGIDSQNRLVEFMSLDYSVGRYVMRLNSAPPTRRSVELEARLEAFPESVPGCKIAQLLRSSNKSDALPLFESEVSRTKELFRQGHRLKGNS